MIFNDVPFVIQKCIILNLVALGANLVLFMQIANILFDPPNVFNFTIIEGFRKST